MHIDTKSVHAVSSFEHGAVVPPVHFSSTFELDIETQSGEYAYQRGSNPTRANTEKAIAALEDAKFGFAFSTGMAATSAVFSLLKAGDEVLLSAAVYGGTFRYVDKFFQQRQLKARFFDDLGAITEADFSENTRLIFAETPGNPNLRVIDIQKLADLAHRHDALLVIDNTFMTGVLQRPLDLGADLVVQSATKFLGGHSDLLAGAVTTNDPQLAEQIAIAQKVFGGVLEPFTSFRLFQSIKTLPLRLERQQSNTEGLIGFLEEHPLIKEIRYPGSYSNEEAEIHSRQAKGIGAAFSFELAEQVDTTKFLQNLELAAFAVSLGGVESLVCLPATMTHEAMSAEAQARAQITPRLIRFATGIEYVGDLIADFDQALKAAVK